MENEKVIFDDPDWGEIDFSDLVDEPDKPEADEEAEGAAVTETVEDNGTEAEANPAEESEPQGAEETQEQPEQTVPQRPDTTAIPAASRIRRARPQPTRRDTD